MYLDNTFSCLFSFIEALSPSLRNWRTLAMSYWSMSVALIWGIVYGADILLFCRWEVSLDWISYIKIIWIIVGKDLISKEIDKLCDHYSVTHSIKFELNNTILHKKSTYLSLALFIVSPLSQIIIKSITNNAAIDIKVDGSYNMFPTTVSLDNSIPGISICIDWTIIKQMAMIMKRSLFIEWRDWLFIF